VLETAAIHKGYRPIHQGHHSGSAQAPYKTAISALALALHRSETHRRLKVSPSFTASMPATTAVSASHQPRHSRPTAAYWLQRFLSGVLSVPSFSIYRWRFFWHHANFEACRSNNSFKFAPSGRDWPYRPAP